MFAIPLYQNVRWTKPKMYRGVSVMMRSRIQLSALLRGIEHSLSNREALWLKNVRIANQLLGGFCAAPHCHEKAIDALHIRPHEFGGDESVENCAPVCLGCRARVRQRPDWAVTVGLLRRGRNVNESAVESLSCWFRGKPRLGDAMMLIHKKTNQAVIGEIITFDAWGHPKQTKISAGDVFDVNDSNYSHSGFWRRRPNHSNWYGVYPNWHSAFSGPEFKVGGLDAGEPW